MSEEEDTTFCLSSNAQIVCDDGNCLPDLNPTKDDVIQNEFGCQDQHPDMNNAIDPQSSSSNLCSVQFDNQQTDPTDLIDQTSSIQPTLVSDEKDKTLNEMGRYTKVRYVSKLENILELVLNSLR